MATININGKDYDADNLTDKAKANIQSLQFTKSQITRLQAQLAVYKTAEIAYAKEVQSEIE
tara:strand:- start:911 stop:1093 length:183 start_codon:yes stop_codon:yes gene_type:complete